MDPHPYGWLSIAPPLATVVLAIVTKRAILSLLAGIFVGALILHGGAPIPAIIATLEEHLWQKLINPFQLRVLGFTLMMGAVIGVVNRSGGMHGMVSLVTPLAKTRRRGQITTWLAGLVVFFDDYTNTLLVGATMRSTCDRLRISREKLAYVVDSTAAPVAGLALLSTWVAIEISYIQDGLNAADPKLVGELTAVGVFLSCLPYRFYMIQALLFVPLVAILGRDFGPMLRAERAALASDSPPVMLAGDEAQSIRPSHWSTAAIPLLTTLATVLALILATGRAALIEDNQQIVIRQEAVLASVYAGAPVAAAELVEVFSEAPKARSLRNFFLQGDSTVSLFYGALVGLGVASTIALGRRLLTSAEVGNAAFAGARAVMPALAILWFASTMSTMTSNGGATPTPETGFPNAHKAFYTGDFLQSLLPSAEEDQAASTMVALSLPTVVFVLASVVAFCTGTSFGTMGILLPIVAPTALLMLGPTAGASESAPLLLAAFGSVLSGAIFGDHCSPISDTTILSSQSSGCDHVAHVVTQLPYALTIATICVLLGTAPLALGISVWLLLPLQTVALVAVLFCFGKRAEDTA